MKFRKLTPQQMQTVKGGLGKPITIKAVKFKAGSDLADG